ncbi:MAG: hypothetical protein H6598_08890 [Flavobacteriales bacterium]|nr:hypothetical protein [Flavobacteriales bacterium]MCB9196326.1 hypothetical protein [Flavobacteriales bacterium]
MEENKKHLDDLLHIRSMMERSSRFLSLSGLSGVFAGIYAIIGAAIVYFDFQAGSLTYSEYVRSTAGAENQDKKLMFLVAIALMVLLSSLVTGYLFTSRKAKKQGLKIWDKSAKRMMLNLFFPLFAGGVLCLVMMHHGLLGMVAPLTLIFYGLGLYGSSKYSFVELKYLGISEVLLGLASAYFYGKGLLFWTIGFGLLHIIYGSLMYFKYEKPAK